MGLLGCPLPSQLCIFNGRTDLETTSQRNTTMIWLKISRKWLQRLWQFQLLFQLLVPVFWLVEDAHGGSQAAVSTAKKLTRQTTLMTPLKFELFIYYQRCVERSIIYVKK